MYTRRRFLELSLIMILFISLSMSPSFFSSADSTQTLWTGDWLQYDGENEEVRWDWFESGLYNASFESDDELMHYEWNERDEAIIGESIADINILRDVGNHDTVLLIDSEFESLAGSYFEENSSVYDLYKVPDHWDNRTWYEDMSGFYGEDSHDEFTWSNATYAVFFPGMIGDEFAFYFDIFGPKDGDQPPPPKLGLAQDDPMFMDPNIFVGLDDRTVVEGTGDYVINGAVQTLDTITIIAQYSVENTTNEIRGFDFGPELGNAHVEMNVTAYLDVYNYYEYVYDAATGIPLEMYEENVFSVVFEAFNTDWTLTFPDMPSLQVGLNFTGDMFNSMVRSNELSQADAFYGEVRPSSIGDNRIEEGDFLGLDMYTYQESNVVMTVGEGGSFTDHRDMEADGWMDLEVYRHVPGAFSASIHGWTGYDENWSSTDPSGYTESGSFHWDEEQFDLFQAFSNDTFEVAPWFPEDENMYFEDGFSMFFEFLNYSVSTEYVTLNINDREYVLEAERYTTFYSGAATGNIWVPEMNTDLDYDAEGILEVSFVYDRWENDGGFLYTYQELFIEADLSGEMWIQTPESPEPYLVDVTGSMDMYQEEDVSIDTHSTAYQSVQIDIPDVPVDDTTTTTDSSDTTTNDSDPEGPDLDLPLPISPVPVFTAMIIAAVVIRRKK